MGSLPPFSAICTNSRCGAFECLLFDESPGSSIEQLTGFEPHSRIKIQLNDVLNGSLVPNPWIGPKHLTLLGKTRIRHPTNFFGATTPFWAAEQTMATMAGYLNLLFPADCTLGLHSERLGLRLLFPDCRPRLKLLRGYALDQRRS